MATGRGYGRGQAPTKLGISLDEVDEKMNTEELMSWLGVQVHRIPEAGDLYHAGKLLYQTGAYGAAAKLLQRYVSGSGSELPGFHLLAYAYYMIGHAHDSRDCLLKCVNNGFDGDWQLLVELQLDLDNQATIAPPAGHHLSPSNPSNGLQDITNAKGDGLAASPPPAIVPVHQPSMSTGASHPTSHHVSGSASSPRRSSKLDSLTASLSTATLSPRSTFRTTPRDITKHAR